MDTIEFGEKRDGEIDGDDWGRTYPKLNIVFRKKGEEERWHQLIRGGNSHTKRGKALLGELGKIRKCFVTEKVNLDLLLPETYTDKEVDKERAE